MPCPHVTNSRPPTECLLRASLQIYTPNSGLKLQPQRPIRSTKDPTHPKRLSRETRRSLVLHELIIYQLEFSCNQQNRLRFGNVRTPARCLSEVSSRKAQKGPSETAKRRRRW